MAASSRPRQAGVLVPLFSLRTQWGWGLGEIPDIAAFAGWAADAGFSVVQFLPVNEITGGETSPYSAASAFALDPVYIALHACPDFQAAGGVGAMSAADQEQVQLLQSSATVDWGAVRACKHRGLHRAFTHFLHHEWHQEGTRSAELKAFIAAEAEWLEDQSLFGALHDRYQTGWWEWPEPLRRRHPDALTEARRELSEVILFRCWAQWQADLQWKAARDAARARGVELMGDLPFVVAGDSADVWARQEEFCLDRRAGTPPDAFSAEGQDWGLPVFNWSAMGRSHFAWFKARAARSGALYGLYRVDHVIGLYRTYFRMNDGSAAGFTPDKEDDQLRLGETLLRLLGQSGRVIAEDLGMVPRFLRRSLTNLGIPGYRVLRWEKDDDVFRDPATWPTLSVATSGTHDIESNAEWYDALSAEERQAVLRLPGLEGLAADQPFGDATRDALLRVVYAAPSELVIVPLQDALGSRERVNVPGTVTARNWTYRMACPVEELVQSRSPAARLADLAAATGRQRP